MSRWFWENCLCHLLDLREDLWLLKLPLAFLVSLLRTKRLRGLLLLMLSLEVLSFPFVFLLIWNRWNKEMREQFVDNSRSPFSLVNFKGKVEVSKQPFSKQVFNAH